MSGLIIHQSNQLEILAETLAGELNTFRRDPLAPAWIVVQSRGMERWLNFELANRNKVACNLRFPFPNALVQDLFAAALGDLPSIDLFERDVLAFRILRTLDACLHEKSMAPLRDYLSGHADDLRRFQLCDKIAGMYDQLATFRPELVRSWNQGESATWQGILWNRLYSPEQRRGHRSELHARFIEQLLRQPRPLTGIPDKLFIFGISNLPALHLSVLGAAARHLEIHLFLLNPCQEFWNDIASEKTQVKATRRVRTPPTSTDNLHFERGHPLLASLGALGRDTLEMLAEFDPLCHDRFQSPAGASLLAGLQRQMLSLNDPGLIPKQSVFPADSSIQIHSCHSRLREIEVLRDAILKQLQDNPSLEPREILVMAPDIESYAPFITAVFEAETRDALKIPFSIADRSTRKDCPLFESFFRLLELKDARMTASQVVEFLEETPVRTRFDLSLDDLELIRHWIAENRICWGIDAAFKEQLGLPASGKNTWEHGWQRMLLGFALPGQDQKLYRGILPYDEIEGGQAEILGRFHRYCEALFAATQQLAIPRTLGDWADVLLELVETFFLVADPSQQVPLTRQLAACKKLGELSQLERTIDFDLLRFFLKKQLSLPARSGFLHGGVTFCSLLPMRSIPFKLVALLGMDDKAFPRKTASIGFDPMAAQPRKGDPSRRKEDRHLFLEALISARDTLFISYLGQNVRDNNQAPPSVVVTELLDAIDQGFSLDTGKDVSSRIVTRHRLQAFNPAYFSSQHPVLCSFSPDNFQGAVSLAGPKIEPPQFMPADVSLPAGDTPDRSLTLTDLIGFIQNPARFFVRNRLQIHLEEASSSLDDQEPFTLDGLTRYQLSRELVDYSLAGQDMAAAFPLWEARGILPAGGMAKPAFAGLVEPARDFAEQVQALSGQGELQSLACHLMVDGMRLTGWVPKVESLGLLHYRCATIKGKDRLAAWVQHLVAGACAQRDGKEAPVSYLLGKNADLRCYPGVADCLPLLARLVDLFKQGQRRPLPFFPESALVYIDSLQRGKDPATSLDNARKKWQGNEYSQGECEDLSADFCFGGSDPLGQEFVALAGAIVEPLLNTETKRSG